MRPKFRYQFVLDDLNNVIKAYYNPKKGLPIEYKVNPKAWEVMKYKITDFDLFPYKKLEHQMAFCIFQIKFQIYNIAVDESLK